MPKNHHKGRHTETLSEPLCESIAFKIIPPEKREGIGADVEFFYIWNHKQLKTNTMGEVTGFSRNLNVASVLLFIIGILGLVYGLQELFLFAYLDEELLGVLASEISAFNQNLLDSIKLKSHFEGLYMLSTALFFCVVSLIPYRKGEKWAWYAMLISYLVVLLPTLAITHYVGALTPFLVIFVILIVSLVAIVLSTKEVFG